MPQDTGASYNDADDNLRAARGIGFGCVMGFVFWLGIALGWLLR